MAVNRAPSDCGQLCRFVFVSCCLFSCVAIVSALRNMPSLVVEGPSNSENGVPLKPMITKWAVLIAGSSGYWNYRHQADVCHAYQILSKNGLKDENIIVFMYDDIAFHEENPRPGVIINSPNGADVYKGVPKDYNGDNVTAQNFLNVLAGNKAAMKGIGSGKVVASGPEDHVFVFYSDHGGPGVLGMPNLAPLFANDLNAVLKAKHEAGGFKELVFYLEACEAGSIFDGLLSPEWNVYALTASSPYESSWATYCPFMTPSPPAGYETCLGDLYSVAWMEDSERRDLNQETLHVQFKLIEQRTSQNGTYNAGSHVIQYGHIKTEEEECSEYMGVDPSLAERDSLLKNEDGLLKMMTTDMAATEEVALFTDGLLTTSLSAGQEMFYGGEKVGVALQRDAELIHLWAKYSNSREGSERKSKALDELSQITSDRQRVDRSVSLITSVLFGTAAQSEEGRSNSRAPGQAVVDDWDCLKNALQIYETSCGPLRQYGMKHMRTFANICNSLISTEALQAAASQACAVYHDISMARF